MRGSLSEVEEGDSKANHRGHRGKIEHGDPIHAERINGAPRISSRAEMSPYPLSMLLSSFCCVIWRAGAGFPGTTRSA